MKKRNWGIFWGVIAVLIVLRLFRAFIDFSNEIANSPEATIIYATQEPYGQFILTDDWSKEIFIEDRVRKTIHSNLRRDDLWHMVQVDGGPANGGFEYEVPPWKDWATKYKDPATGKPWQAPNLTGSHIRFRLIPEKNNGVKEAWYSYSVLKN